MPRVNWGGFSAQLYNVYLSFSCSIFYPSSIFFKSLSISNQSCCSSILQSTTLSLSLCLSLCLPLPFFFSLSLSLLIHPFIYLYFILSLSLFHYYTIYLFINITDACLLVLPLYTFCPSFSQIPLIFLSILRLPILCKENV